MKEMAKKYTEKEVIKEAEKWEGYLEKKSVGTDSQLQNKTWNAGNNNITWFWTWLERNGCLDLQGGAWCDGFVDYCHAVVAGVDKAKASLNGYSGYTPTSAQYFKNAGRWVPSSGKPLVGDQIFFKNSSRICHTGIVTKVTDTTVYTIEGNTSSTSGVVANGGCVRKKSYARSYSRIAGYGRPLYRDFCIISKGMTGSIVKARQQLLMQKGFSVGVDGADGDCGANTVKAINAAQKALGLSQTGHLNKTTYNALIKLEDTKETKTETAFKKYELTDAQIRGLSALCLQEQGCLKGVMAEASLMCNLFEKQTKYLKLVDYVIYGGWFAKAQTYYNNGVKKSVGSKYDDAVRKVICDGFRVLPDYINEHDCFSDITSATNNGNAINKKDRNAYKKNVTKLKNCYGSSYTFYCFPDSTCDPFGYTKKGTNDFCYDYDGVAITNNNSEDKDTKEETNSESNNSNTSKDDTFPFTGEVTAKSGLNMRLEPSSTAKKATKTSTQVYGARLTVLSETTNSVGEKWYLVEKNGYKSYCLAKYIKRI